MLSKKSIELQQSGVLNKLVSDYLKRDPFLTPFYSHFPDKQGYQDLLHSKPYKEFPRQELSAILKRQSELTDNCSEKSSSNIQRLGKEASYTVTTGHQLCLFTGPLYFLYKIISAINLAETLAKEFPGNHFVPVYWMASEDHDFPEVNNFYVNGKKLEWSSAQAGAVGDFNTAELQTLLSDLDLTLGKSERAEYLKNLFEQAYLKHNNLADATRYLVNELFGDYGIVIIDGNDAAFKKQFSSHFKADIFDNLAYHQTEKDIRSLQHHNYQIQVNPRPINCFYLEKGARLRIERQGDRFRLVGSEKSFSVGEMEQLIAEHPEKISPNVVLRPLYQQVILPNIAYIGGPGELAYWLEFKALFDVTANVFPILNPRNFVSIIDKLNFQKLSKLGFDVSAIFKSEQELIREIQINTSAIFDLDSEKSVLDDLYETIQKRITAIDTTLNGAVLAELKRSQNGFERLSAKANRAYRRKLETELNRIRQIKDALFPGGTPQERVVNFSEFYLSFGKDFIETLKTSLNPLDLQQTVLLEE